MSRQRRAHVVELASLTVAKARPSAGNDGSGHGVRDLGLELLLQEANKGFTKG